MRDNRRDQHVGSELPFMRQGTIPTRETQTGALALIGAVQEVLRDWVTGTDRPPLDPIVEDLVTVFLSVARGVGGELA